MSFFTLVYDLSYILLVHEHAAASFDIEANALYGFDLAQSGSQCRPRLSATTRARRLDALRPAVAVYRHEIELAISRCSSIASQSLRTDSAESFCP